VFLFRLSRLGRIGPVGIALTGYQLWRRLSPKQRAAIRTRGREMVTRTRRRHVAKRPADLDPSAAARVGAATAPQEETPVVDERPG
jgi:hypothetical protein